MKYEFIDRIAKIPEKLSVFLFGPRQCGKSHLVKFYLEKLGQSYWEVDLLKSDQLLKYTKQPELFRKEALHQIEKNGAKTVFVDEIQKLPILLDEVHHLIEKTGCRFILTGSSARKLKRDGANLLAGRAVHLHLFPFLYREISNNFDLSKALQFGTLPAIYNLDAESARLILNAYTQTYLREEIQQEGIVRNLAAFSRFLDVACAQFTEITHFTNIGSECAVSPQVVRTYYEILEDTLIGFKLRAWDTSVRKQLTSHPRFYFFDNGVVNSVNHLLKDDLSPVVTGKLFEQWVVNEIKAYLSYTQSDLEMFYWRTNNGAEVDVILSKRKQALAAIEIKATGRIQKSHLSGLRSFASEYPDVKKYVVSFCDNPYDLNGVEILPWKYFLTEVLPKLG